MKKPLSILILLTVSLCLFGQDWYPQVERTSGKSKVKTLKITTGTEVDIGDLKLSTDTLTAGIYYKGKFLGVTGDSLRIKLESVKEVRTYSNGKDYTKITPAKFYSGVLLQDTNKAFQFALPDIDYLHYSRLRPRKVNPFVPFFLGPMAVLILSPLISYDFKNQSLNTERYKYWAIGSTIASVTGFTIPLVIQGKKQKRIQFTESWPNKYDKPWKFR